MHFIEEYQIDTGICDKLIKDFNEKSAFSCRGAVINNKELVELPDHKSSTDLHSDFIDPNLISEYYDELHKCMTSYIETYPELNGLPEFRSPECRIQKYVENEGFPCWHFERGDSHDTYYRCLVYMTYLNDVPEGDGGETEFKYQNKKFIPKKGKTIIWPSDWTHTHRGNKIISGEKYIITGWMINIL